MNILWYEIFGVGLGLLMMWYYAKNATSPWARRIRKSSLAAGPRSRRLVPLRSIMGSALSFLLVFRLSWSFGRWWEARGLIGTAMTKMRNLASMITANSDAPTMDQAMALLELRLVCKLHVATMIDILGPGSGSKCGPEETTVVEVRPEITTGAGQGRAAGPGAGTRATVSSLDRP